VQETKAGYSRVLGTHESQLCRCVSVTSPYWPNMEFVRIIQCGRMHTH